MTDRCFLWILCKPRLLKIGFLVSWLCLSNNSQAIAQYCSGLHQSLKAPSLIYPNTNQVIRTGYWIALIDNPNLAAHAIRLQINRDTNIYPFSKADGFFCNASQRNYTDRILVYNQSEIFSPVGKRRHIVPVRVKFTGKLFFTFRMGKSGGSSPFTDYKVIEVQAPSNRLLDFLAWNPQSPSRPDPEAFIAALTQRAEIATWPVDTSIEVQFDRLERWLEGTQDYVWLLVYEAQYYQLQGYTMFAHRCLQLAQKTGMPPELRAIWQRIQQTVLEDLDLQYTLNSTMAGLSTFQLAVLEGLQNKWENLTDLMEHWNDTRENANRVEAIKIWYQQAELFARAGDQKKAGQYLEMAYKQATGEENPLLRAELLYHLAKQERTKHQPQLMLVQAYLDSAFLFAFEAQNPHVLSSLYELQGHVHLDNNALEAAIEVFDNMRRLADFTGDLEQQIEAHQRVMETYLQLNDCYKAYAIPSKIDVLKDSLQAMQLRCARFLAAKLHAEQTAAKVTLLAAEEQKRAHWRLLSLAIILGISLWSIYRIRKKNKQLASAKTTIEKSHQLLKIIYQEAVHRTRNYFGVLGSSLNRLIRKTGSTHKNLAQGLESLQQQIFIFRDINNTLGSLVQDLDAPRIDGQQILRQIISNLALNYRFIYFDTTNIAAIPLKPRVVDALGLIVHEAVLNAVKHGNLEAQEAPVISVRLTLDNDLKEPKYVLEIANSGAPMQMDSLEMAQGQGIQQIRAFAAMLEGTAVWENMEEGGVLLKVHWA